MKKELHEGMLYPTTYRYRYRSPIVEWMNRYVLPAQRVRYSCWQHPFFAYRWYWVMKSLLGYWLYCPFVFQCWASEHRPEGWTEYVLHKEFFS